MSSSSSFSTTTTTNRSGRAEQWWWLWDNRAPLRRPSQRCCGGAGLDGRLNDQQLCSYHTKLANIYIGSLGVGHLIETDISRILKSPCWNISNLFKITTSLHFCRSFMRIQLWPKLHLCRHICEFVVILCLCQTVGILNWSIMHRQTITSRWFTVIIPHWAELTWMDPVRTLQSKRGSHGLECTLRYIVIQSIRGGCMGHNRSNGLWKEV